MREIHAPDASTLQDTSRDDPYAVTDPQEKGRADEPAEGNHRQRRDEQSGRGYLGLPFGKLTRTRERTHQCVAVNDHHPALMETVDQTPKGIGNCRLVGPPYGRESRRWRLASTYARGLHDQSDPREEQREREQKVRDRKATKVGRVQQKFEHERERLTVGSLGRGGLLSTRVHHAPSALRATAPEPTQNNSYEKERLRILAGKVHQGCYTVLGMELRINLVFVAILGAIALFGRAGEPEWVDDTRISSSLVAAEDAFFRDLGDAGKPGVGAKSWTKVEDLRELLKAYVDADQPALAVALAGRARAQSRRDPYVTYQLARAYGKLGRFEDAADTARLARTRCESEMYSSERLTVPRAPCSVRLFVAMDTHVRAMETLVHWNVASPSDSRYDRAFEVVQRTARLASVDGGL